MHESPLISQIVSRVRRRLFVGRVIRMWPGAATACFAAAALLAMLGRDRIEGTTATALLATAAAASVVFPFVWAWVNRPDAATAAQELDRRCNLAERVSSAVALAAATSTSSATTNDAPIAAALRADAERAVAGIDLATSFPLFDSHRAPARHLPAVAMFLLAAWAASRSSFETPAPIDPTEAAQIESAATALEKKLALRKRSAEELKLVEAKRLLEKLQAEARQMQSAKALDRKEALIKLNDLGRQLDERRESIDTAAAIRKQLSKLRSKQSPAADKLNQALSRGDYRAAAEQLQRLQKELDAASSTDEQRTAAAKQLDDLQRQLDEIAQKSEARRDEAQRQSDAASIPGTGGEPSETSAAEAETASKQLAALSSQGEQLRRLQTSAEQGAEAMRSGNAAQAKSALEDLQRQLDGLTAQSEELTLLDEGLRDVAATKAGLAQGSGGADATSPGAGESPGGPTSDEGPSGGEPSKAAKTGGLQPGIGTSDRVHSTDDAATDTAAANLVDARVRTEPGVGELNVVGPADGPNAKGRALEAIREQAATLSNAAAQQPVVNPSLDRSRRAQKRQYFDALREAP